MMTLHVFFTFWISSKSSLDVYFSIIGANPINRPTVAKYACSFHGTHQRSRPNHVAVGKHTRAVAETCLGKVNFQFFIQH